MEQQVLAIQCVAGTFGIEDDEPVMSFIQDASQAFGFRSADEELDTRAAAQAEDNGMFPG
jgi:hypothetical protein